MRRRYQWLIGLLVLFGVPYYWLLIDNRPGTAPVKTIDVAELRRLAEAIPGPKPESVHVELAGWRRLPGTLLVAGGGLKRNLVGIEAFLLRGPWGDIAIDSGLGPKEARTMRLERYDPAAQALLPPEQGPGGPLAGKLPWPAGSRDLIKPFRDGRIVAVAPGVVVLKTPGHTPGSRMIYARLRDGREYLFAGDTATMARNWMQLRARSRLVSTWVAPEDRAAVFGWLKGLRALHRAAPEVFIVPGHDYDHLVRNSARYRIAPGFEAPPSPPDPAAK